ncbi:MAG: ankyrin repeat domain-containing protein [Lactobacillales bacterium]|jgi:ankyrin repeat protein|nr:ankyrin repeat domain-containing protein [Lactobacillales bacterium]
MIKKKYKILLAIAFAFLSLNLANQVHADPVRYDFKKVTPVSELTKLMVPNPFQTMTPKQYDAFFASFFNVTVKKGKFSTNATFFIDVESKKIRSTTSDVYSYATGQLAPIEIVPTKEELLKRLEQATKADNPQEVQKILTFGVIDINNDLFSNGANALQHAIYLGKRKTAELLIEHPDVDIDKKDIREGLTPLMHAVKSNITTIVEKLIRCGKQLDVNKPKNDGKHNPLTMAIEQGNYEIYKLLADYGADINWQTSTYDIPLSFAINFNRTQIALDLIKRNCNFNIANICAECATAGPLAIEKNNMEVFQRLLHSGRYQFQYYMGSSIEFMIAIKTKNIEIVKLLLDVYKEKMSLTNAAFDFAKSNFDSKAFALVENYLFTGQAEEESDPSSEPLSESEDRADDQREGQTLDESVHPVGSGMPSASEEVIPEIPFEEEEDVSEPVAPTSELPQRTTPPVPTPRRRPARIVFNPAKFVNDQFANWQGITHRYNGGRNLKYITMDMHTGGASVEPVEYAATFINTVFDRLVEVNFTGELTLVTGQGRHSRTRGFSSVKEAALAYLGKIGIAAHQPHPRNSGRILIQFRDGRPAVRPS